MDKAQIMSDDEKYIANTYARFGLVAERGEGGAIYDADGKEYLDFSTGIGVNIFGLCDREWQEAVIGQIGRIQHVCNLYYSEPQTKLAKALCRKTGAAKVFFGNSGAEANECAIKVARKYSHDKYGGGRYEIITLNNSFHGRTLATLAATGQDAFHRYFGPFPEGFRYAEPTMKGILEQYTDKTCAVMVEVVQGESGVNALDGGFLKELQTFLKERDILLICDEVQCGNGRTGYMYAYEAFGLEPDIVTTAKGLGGGLPIGACMLFDKCKNTLGAGDHGTTFGGNPIACAGALSIVERLSDDLLAEVRGKGAYLKEHISRIRNVLSVSGMGLMIGIETKKSARDVAEKCLKKGLIVLTAHGKVRLLPPLNVSKAEMDEAIAILNEVIAE